MIMFGDSEEIETGTAGHGESLVRCAAPVAIGCVAVEIAEANGIGLGGGRRRQRCENEDRAETCSHAIPLKSSDLERLLHARLTGNAKFRPIWMTRRLGRGWISDQIITWILNISININTLNHIFEEVRQRIHSLRHIILSSIADNLRASIRQNV